MSSRTKPVLSIAVLVLAAAACRSGAPPSSNTPATAEAANGAPSSASTSIASGSDGTAPGAVDSAGHAAPAGHGSVVTDSVPADPQGIAGTQAAAEVPSADTSGADAPASGAEPATPLTDAQIAAVTDGVNKAEIEQAKLAKTKAKNPQVRRFATMMIEHHGAAQKKQAALKLETEQSALSQELAQDAQSTLESLQGTSDSDFDSAYMTAQVEAHQKVLAALQRDLRPGAQDPALKRYLSQLEPQVSQHLEQARKTEAALQARDTAGGSAKTSSR